MFPITEMERKNGYFYQNQRLTQKDRNQLIHL